MENNSHSIKSKRSNFKKISTSDDWFEVYEIADNLFVFCEPRHYENTIVNLVVGEKKAALIDTGCGIGNLRRAVEEVTDKPVMVINTHTHSDHLGSNRQFDEIAMFDHPLARRVAEKGVSHQILLTDILAEKLVTGPWPRDFDPNVFAIPPFTVSHWLIDGDQVDLGGRQLQAVYTPGEAQDHICLLDSADRLLFCGDILLQGPVWTHLEGGSLEDLIASYRKLMGFLDDFDYLMPGHNQPWLDKKLLPATLAGNSSSIIWPGPISRSCRSLEPKVARVFLWPIRDINVWVTYPTPHGIYFGLPVIGNSFGDDPAQGVQCRTLGSGYADRDKTLAYCSLGVHGIVHSRLATDRSEASLRLVADSDSDCPD